ncbi:TIGR00282 family metallophosphoesterase [Spiroplasma endosymbiont of Aspidapion aeneum]|uniref:TIGR00282 family metallophosphoesterase n=1 Tax=Spiroplasma endosymbiont of Aspidapion aeneum TaxID=3066276 RepID=UPI00313DC4E6
MNILVIGDIFAKPGRMAISQLLPNLIKENKIDFIIANGENICHGKGINIKSYDLLIKENIDVITSGNHIFKNKEVDELFKNYKNILRPANWYKGVPGHGSVLVEKNNIKIRVTNIMGKVFMDYCNNPYEAMDKIIALNDWDIHIVDFHGEASAEKIAFAYNYDGVISGVVGTHTHVQTADNRILPKGTGFITDIGMTGCYESIIGADIASILEKEKFNKTISIKPAKGNFQLCGVILAFKNNILNTIKRINIKSM